jgi:adenine-specific DNA-methyltransferase
MIHERLHLIRDLLTDDGSIFVHVDERIGPYVRLLLDELFGRDNFINCIIWRRSDAHSDVGQGAKHLGRICDNIFYYSKAPESQILNMQFSPLPASTIEKWYRHVEEGTGRRYNKADITGPGGAVKGNPVYNWKGITRAWRFSKTRMEDLDREGLIVYSASGSPT